MIAAAVVTHGDLNGDLIVDNQNPVRVFGITITNIDTTDTFEVTFSGSDNVDFLSVAVLPGTSHTIDVPFLADGGIKAETLGATDGPTCKVTFFHTQAGS